MNQQTQTVPARDDLEHKISDTGLTLAMEECPDCHARAICIHVGRSDDNTFGAVWWCANGHLLIMDTPNGNGVMPVYDFKRGTKE